MWRRSAVFAGVYCAVILAGGPVAMGDWYDAFNDGEYGGQGGGFHIDNPNWTERIVAATTYLTGVDEGRARITCENTWLPLAFAGLSVEENTSDCYFDNSVAHYMIANVRTHDDTFPDPNLGMTGLWVLTDMAAAWTAYDFEWEPSDGWMSITSYSGFTWIHLADIDIDDDGYPISLVDPASYDPCDPDPNTFEPGNPMEKIWLVIQFDPFGSNHDANNPDDPNDPNCHWVRGAAWKGAKHDWDGNWTMQGNCVGALLGGTIIDEINGDFPFDPNIHMDLYVHEEGYDCVAAFAGGDTYWPPYNPCDDVSYDDFEVRSGYFTNVSHTLTLNVVKPEMGVVWIDPDLLDDPNEVGWHDPSGPSGYDPNYPPDPNFLRRYTDGTQIVLTAQANSGKMLKEWTIYDPNYPGDANHAVFDTNTVLYLTMDADWEVQAKFKCGSSVPPFVAMTLLALGLAVVVRRLF